MTRLEDLVLSFLIDSQEIIRRQGAQGEPMSDLSEFGHIIVGCQSLDKALVEILAGLEKINITLLPLALLAVPVLLVLFRLLKRLVTGDNLAIAIVDRDVCIPKAELNTLSCRILEVEEDGVLAFDTQPGYSALGSVLEMNSGYQTYCMSKLSTSLNGVSFSLNLL
jgi:hypothetical protein